MQKNNKNFRKINNFTNNKTNLEQKIKIQNFNFLFEKLFRKLLRQFSDLTFSTTSKMMNQILYLIYIYAENVFLIY